MNVFFYFKTNKSDSAFIHTWCYSSCRRQDTLKKEGLNGGTSLTLIFWLCNLKQLNFRRFLKHLFNSKKIHCNIKFFFQEEKNRGQKSQIILFSISGNFGHFPTIPDYFRRFPKTTEDVRRLEKISEDKTKNFDFIVVVIFICERYIFTENQIWVSREKPSKQYFILKE